MKRYQVIAVIGLAIAGFSAQATADGRGHRGHRYSSNFRLFVGTPGWWGPGYFGPGYYGPAPYYYAPRTVIIQPDLPVYIQRAPAVVVQPSAAVAQAPSVVWYYCPEPAGYYPAVPSCSQPWVSVDPASVAPAPAQ